MPCLLLLHFSTLIPQNKKIDLHEKGPFCLPRLFITIIIIIIDTIIIIIVDTIIIIDTIIILAQMEDSIAEGK